MKDDHASPPLSPDLVLRAYCVGAFPMARGRSGEIDWFRPDPRSLLPIEASRFHVPRSLGRRVRSGRFRVTFDRAFDAVIRACAGPRRDEPDTWISDAIIDVYAQLHRAGYAHSVEAWIGEPKEGEPHEGEPDQSEPGESVPNAGASTGVDRWQLVGGLYGVALGGAFFGESMFSRRTDASKVCLVKLVEHLRGRGFTLLDVQFPNPHLDQFGAYELSCEDYLDRLRDALEQDVRW